MDLTEAEDIKKRWQEYTEELYKKDLHDPDNHDGVITDLEPDILECEVKWALESITTNKASGGDVIPVELQARQAQYYKVLSLYRQQSYEAALAALEEGPLPDGKENLALLVRAANGECKGKKNELTATLLSVIPPLGTRTCATSLFRRHRR